MPIQYFLISDGEKSLGEQPRNQKLREVLLTKVVPKLDRTNHKRVLTQDNSNVYLKVSGKYYFFCVATQDIKQRIPWNFIDEVEIETLKNPIIASSQLKDKFKFYNDPNNDKIQKLQNEIDKALEVQTENMTKIFNNQEKLNTLVADTEELKDQGEDFERGGRKLKNSMRRRLILIIVIAIIVVAIILAIIVIVLLAVLIPKK
ncbi:hypothetical protein ABK040_001564 [Willaertia magna]